MGFFSWKTADTEESISNKFSSKGSKPCKLVLPNGDTILENDYEGYGIFGGMDYYDIVADLNDGVGRTEGIDISFNKKDPILPKIVTIDCLTKWENLPNSEICEHQGFFYND